MTNILQTVRTRNVNNYVIMHNGRDVMVNFEPSEYMRKISFPSVTQAARKKRSEYLSIGVEPMTFWTGY